MPCVFAKLKSKALYALCKSLIFAWRAPPVYSENLEVNSYKTYSILVIDAIYTFGASLIASAEVFCSNSSENQWMDVPAKAVITVVTDCGKFCG